MRLRIHSANQWNLFYPGTPPERFLNPLTPLTRIRLAKSPRGAFEESLESDWTNHLFVTLERTGYSCSPVATAKGSQLVNDVT